jgi:hypothetical protein
MAGANAPGCEGLEPFFGLNWGLITIDAIGNSTLMGLVTDHQHHCTPLPFDPELAGPPPLGVPMPFVNGYAELRAANGDKIWGTYHGLATFTLAGMIIDGDLTTTGGTGRFEGANGLGHAFGVQSPNSAAMTITGTMTSPGEAKKNK